MANSMEKDKSEDLVLQGIFIKNDSREYLCYICNQIIPEKNLAYKHVNKNRHIKTMEIFIKHFEITKDVIKCKTCQAIGTWAFVQYHAKLHKLNFCYEHNEPEDKYKQCFENFLIIHEKQFHCNLCCFTYQFFSWYDALIHIEDKKHITIKSLVQNAGDIFSHDSNALEKYECIVSNCLVYLCELGYFYCWVCNTNVSGTTNLIEHIKGKRHNTAKLTFKFESLERNIVLAPCTLKIPIGLFWIAKAHKIVVFKDSLYCELCNVTMTNESAVKSHLTRHTRFTDINQKQCNNKLNKACNMSTEAILSASNCLNTHDLTNDIIQDKHANAMLKVPKKRGNKELYSFDTESIFFIADEIKSKHLVGLTKAIDIKGIRQNLTKLALAKKGINDSTDEFLTCMLCNSKIRNVDASLQEHINSKDHWSHYYTWMETCLKFYNEILVCTKNNWYYINKYYCDICHTEFSSEIYFARHMDKNKDTHFNLSNYNYHSCVPCRLLWYGSNLLYFTHGKTVEHKYMVSYESNITNKFPNETEKLLILCEENSEMLLEFSDIISMTTIKDEILTSLRNYILPTFKEAEAYAYGSRVYGSGLPDSDINIFFDCSNVFCEKNVYKKKRANFIKKIENILSSKSDVWDVKEIKSAYRTTIMKVWFKPRKLYCSISFEKALDVESTNLIKRFNEVCTPCRKLILILKKWLSFCGLSGFPYISNYALTWCVIFYLQRMLILPSVIELIQEKNKSKLVDGWQAGVSYNFGSRGNSDFPFRKLLSGFFIFYADFDYRSDVICPLLGNVIERKAFTDLSLLPNDMALYIEYVTNTKNPKLFSLSPMCLQDPFNLSDNLTAMIQKSTLNTFRIFCSKSVEILTG